MAVEAAPRRAEREQALRRVCPERALAATALTAWAAVFWFLLFTGRVSLYLSSRTAWVVPTGAAVLTLAALGRIVTLRVEDPRPVGRRGVWGVGLIVAPVVIVLALPPASLGSYAAARRSTLTAGAAVASAGDIAEGELSLVDVAGALRSREGMRALVRRAGEQVSFVGFVTRERGMPADEFVLTRFLISCCVADALSVQVRVVGAPPGRFKPDDWVRVEGAMYPLGREVIVDAESVRPVDKPEHPYLNP